MVQDFPDYRAKAEECRRLADRTSCQIRLHWLRVAEGWDALAVAAETHEKTKRPGLP